MEWLGNHESMDCSHRLNIELDIQNLFGLHVYSFTHWLRPCIATPQFPSPPHLGSFTRAPLVSQDWWHLSVTPWVHILQRLPSEYSLIWTKAAILELPAGHFFNFSSNSTYPKYWVYTVQYFTRIYSKLLIYSTYNLYHPQRPWCNLRSLINIYTRLPPRGYFPHNWEREFIEYIHTYAVQYMGKAERGWSCIILSRSRVSPSACNV